jgi:RNA 3'-terminal phosphate cyclase-like protein
MTRLQGSEALRTRLALATVTGRPLRLDAIRPDDPLSPGLRPWEASLLRLLEKVTAGAAVEINETGTALKYRPGVIVGGALAHACHPGRGLTYYLEPLLLISLFARKPVRAVLQGVTDGGADPSVDAWRAATLPLVRRAAGLGAGVDAATSLLAGGAVGELSLRLTRRGVHPGGGGEAALAVPALRGLPPVCLVEEGLVRRVRGVAFAARTSPSLAARAVDGARGVLNALLADVFIFTDHCPAAATGGRAPGYGVTLVAETTTGALLAAEAGSATPGLGTEGGGEGGGGGGAAAGRPRPPEEVGALAARALLATVEAGGAVGPADQGLAFTLAALADASASEVRTGQLTPHAAAALRACRDVLGVTFALRPDAGTRTVLATCVGAGVRNAARKAT